MIYALVAIVLWGAATHFIHAPLLLLVAGALLITAGGFWLERERLTRAAPASRRDFYLLLAAAYAFVAIVAIGVVALISALIPLALHR